MSVYSADWIAGSGWRCQRGLYCLKDSVNFVLETVLEFFNNL